MSIKKLGVLLLSAGFGLALILSGSCGAGQKPRNESISNTGNSVIVIVIDGLRTDALSSFGAERSSAPAIDGLAAQSLRFQQAWAQSSEMAPSLASLLTGLYPTTDAMVEPGEDLAAEASSIAEIASAGGFQTAAFLAGGEGEGEHGLAQGFGVITRAPMKLNIPLGKWLDENQGRNIFVLAGGWSLSEEMMASLEDTSLRSKLSGRRVAGSVSPEDQLGTKELNILKLAYGKALSKIDLEVAALLKELENRKLMESATVVLLGSNGVALGEGGDVFSETLAPAATHVPLCIRRPGGTGAGDISKVVELADLAPTLEEMMALEIPAETQGASLLEIMGGGGHPPYIAFAESDRHGGMRSVAMDGMQLMVVGENVRLCELSVDPFCIEDATSSYPERAQVLEEHLDAWSKMVSAASLDPERKIENLDEDTLEQLKSLGYIQ